MDGGSTGDNSEGHHAMTDELREAVTDVFLSEGFDLATAESFADFTFGLSRRIAVIEFQKVLSALSGTIYGTALRRELCGDYGESLKSASRRLRCSPNAIRKTQKVIRKCLAALKSKEAVPPCAMLRPSENEII